MQLISSESRMPWPASRTPQCACALLWTILLVAVYLRCVTASHGAAWFWVWCCRQDADALQAPGSVGSLLCIAVCNLALFAGPITGSMWRYMLPAPHAAWLRQADLTLMNSPHLLRILFLFHMGCMDSLHEPSGTARHGCTRGPLHRVQASPFTACIQHILSACLLWHVQPSFFSSTCVDVAG